MASKEPSDRTGHIVDIKILDVEKRKKTGPKHYVYVIQVTWANPANVFIIYRRYAQFFDFQCQLLDLFDETPSEGKSDNQTRVIPFLPGKIILGRSQVRQIALERKDGLNEYCQALIALPEQISRSSAVLEFFRPSPTDIEKPTESIVEEEKPIDKSALVISEPAKLANYRCLADFTATEKLELSLKRNTMVQVLQKHPNGWWFVQSGDQTGFVPGAFLEPSELKRGAREGKTIEKSLNETFIVNTAFEGKGKDELSLEQGSFVTVIEKSLTGWWKIKFNNTIGQYPAIYLSSTDGRRTPENVLDDFSNRNSKKQASNNSNDSDDDEEDDYPNPSKASKSITDKNGKNNKALSSITKVPPKPFEKIPNSPVTKQDKDKEKEKVSASVVRKNFESPSSTNTTDQSKSIKPQPPKEITNAQKSSSVTIPSAFRPVNNKPVTTTSTTSKISSIVTPTPLRPVNDKQETTTVAKKFPIPSSSSFRPINDKQETTSAQKSSSVTIPSAFRPVTNKPETASASKTSSVTTSTPFRPVTNKPETTGASKTSSTPFRPVTNKPETTSASKNSSVTSSTPFRPTNTKEEPTQKSIKDLVGKFNHK